jgi:tRNA threonylcarbamoyladenosine dehydratase
MNHLSRLYGQKAQKFFSDAHVLLIGVGGVGSWVAEALARSGVGEITLVDLDDICVSNINRQVHALHSTVGKIKIDVLAERLMDINPNLKLHLHHTYFSEKNAMALFETRYQGVIDACDDFSAKILLCQIAFEKKIHLLTIGAAGGKTDPSLIRSGDLTESKNDKLLSRIRKKLRQDHNFPREDVFNIQCIYSMERAVYPTADGCLTYESRRDGAKLDCETGFGSASFVTGSFAFFAVSSMFKYWVTKYELASHT